jgi:hypothetical protein
MMSFPENQALTLWLGLALFLLIEALFITRQVGALWDRPCRSDPRGNPGGSHND